jgi:hypothetical protein
MSPQPLPPERGSPLPAPQDSDPEHGLIRRLIDEIVSDALIVLLFSAIAAIPMRLIFGSWTPWTFAVGALAAAALFAHSAYSRRRQSAIARAWTEAGWVDEPARAWPWDPAARRNHGLVQVRFAKSNVVNGFPVTLVEAFWVGGGMDGSASSFSGYGTIIVVRLPVGSVRPDSSPPGTRISGDDLYVVVAERPFAAFSATGPRKPPPFHPMPLGRVPEHTDWVLAVVDRLGIRPD